MPFVALVPLAIAVVSAASAAYASKSASDAQNRVFENTQKSALRSTLNNYEALAQQGNQAREQAGQEATQNALAAAKARATTQAAAASSNIAGLSVDQVLNETTNQEGQNYVNIAANEAAANDQRALQAQGVQAQGISQAQSVAPGGFNPIVGLLQIGVGAANGYYGTGGTRDRLAAANAGKG